MRVFLHLAFSVLLLCGIYLLGYTFGRIAAADAMPARFYWDEPAGAPAGSEGSLDHTNQKSLQEALEEDPCFKFTIRNLRRP